MFSIITEFVIPFLIVLSILVLIHEFGHFITAKRLGIKVEEFGFGFPPRVFGKKIGETIYSINLLPIGGFVKLFGEDAAGGGSVQRTKTQEPITDIKRAFFARPAWQRATIVLAGVIMNFVLAVIIISYLFSVPGVVVPKGYAEVVGTVSGSPAEQAGLQKGDIVVSFNDKKIETVPEMRKILSENGDKKGKLVTKRAGEQITYEISPQKKTEKGKTVYLVGVELEDVRLLKYPWYTAPFFGTIEALKFSWMIVQGIGGIFLDVVTQGKPPAGATGPVGVAEIVGKAVKISFEAGLWVTAIISLNLAVVNVLPIPALDGGRLFFIMIELVTRKKISPRYEAIAHAVGLAILLTLILAITLFDISRVLSGQSLLPKM